MPCKNTKNGLNKPILMALKKISKKIETLPASGIHFIDNGHYHYVTKL